MKALFVVLFCFLISTQSAFATVDPRSFDNNKFGMGTLSPEGDIEDISSLVNTNGDWGYIVILIERDEINVDRWQNVLSLATKHHLIPIIRLATEPEGGIWKKPEEKDVELWADFLSKLYFPTKNKYVQVYNEVNRASEWGGTVDPEGYAKELVQTTQTLKNKDPDFFILNAPLDLALSTSGDSLDAGIYFDRMEASSPGIFKRLDGWASHSYPNPEFSSSPYKTGRTGISGYNWELSRINSYLENKDLPVFITETGWQRATNNSLGLSEELISDYYKIAFEEVWVEDKVVTVAPFIFNYPDGQFNKFSFKTSDSVLGKKYYSYFDSVKGIDKVDGRPLRENEISELELASNSIFLVDRNQRVRVTFRNTGNYVWKIDENLGIDLSLADSEITRVNASDSELYPGEKAEVTYNIKAKTKGDFPLKLNISVSGQNIASDELIVKSETLLSLILNTISEKLI